MLLNLNPFVDEFYYTHTCNRPYAIDSRTNETDGIAELSKSRLHRAGRWAKLGGERRRHGVDGTAGALLQALEV